MVTSLTVLLSIHQRGWLRVLTLSLLNGVCFLHNRGHLHVFVFLPLWEYSQLLLESHNLELNGSSSLAFAAGWLLWNFRVAWILSSCGEILDCMQAGRTCDTCGILLVATGFCSKINFVYSERFYYFIIIIIISCTYTMKYDLFALSNSP